MSEWRPLVKKILLRLFFFILSVSAVIANFAISGLIMASVHRLQWLAYPTYFGAYMLLCGLVFTVLVPVSSKHAVTPPFLRRFLTVDDARFSKGIWRWVRRRGAFTLVLVSALLLGPFFAALVIRFLGLSEHKAWLYSFSTTLINAAVWVSLYLGVFSALRRYLGSVTF